MADNNVTDRNLVKLHINHEYGVADINIEDVDYEDIVKMETEVVGGYWIHQNMEELLQNKNEGCNLELGNDVKQLLNKNAGKVCENCNEEYKDYCMNCGHLIHIFDNEMKAGIFLRAMRSIPYNILKIKGSLMEGYGVYAISNIPKGVKFGPYEGLETVKRKNKYFWKIRYAKLIEADGEDYCNWMRFINCATAQIEQNLIALQFMGKIYYKALRQIKIGEELLIYYSSNGYNHLEFSSVQYFQPHIEQINENIFKCPPCCFGFSEEKYLVNHNRVCPNKKGGVTEVKTSTDMKELEDHTKICEANNLGSNHQNGSENKMHDKASLDGEEKVLEQDFIEHLEINNKIVSHHTLEKRYKCNECSYVAGRKNHLVTHIQFRHTMDKPYKCSECSYTAVLKSSLQFHIRSRHTMEKPYKCNECSYTAVRKFNLLSHIKSCHAMEKPYKCNECSYAAVRKENLQSHIKSRHAMDKPYSCNECSYTAVQKRSLAYHIKCHHTVEKPYKCNECSYAAGRRDSLLSHIKCRHTMEKPYKCNECSYAAAEKGSLHRHIKCRHTVEKS